jgi:hypothetical protein
MYGDIIMLIHFTPSAHYYDETYLVPAHHIQTLQKSKFHCNLRLCRRNWGC